MAHNSTILLEIISWIIILVLSPYASAKVVEHTFIVHSIVSKRLCKDQIITVVNNSSPGPTIYVEEGDSLVVHVVNQSPYEISIHWHGVKQKLSCWADGVAYITQCPVRPRYNYTYRFELSGQEGTFWWHAHNNFHRATVYGGLIIYPKGGRSYPFQKPDEEVPIILGEWWNRNVTGLLEDINNMGVGPNSSDANLINGLPGHMYSCTSYGHRSLNVLGKEQYPSLQFHSSRKNGEPGTFKLKVSDGKTYLLRIISAAVDPSIFLKIANHNMTVVALDASYTTPYLTDVLVISPGQTIDVLLIANQPPATYYITTSVFVNSDVVFNPTPGTSIIVYEDAPNGVPKLPIIPDHHDNELFYNALGGSLTALVTAPFWEPVPLRVDEQLLITIGLGFQPCNKTMCALVFDGDKRISGALNNITFQLPDRLSILEAYYNKVDGVYTVDFPNNPPLMFDFTNEIYRVDSSLVMTEKATKLKRFKYNTTIEIVFQCTGLITPENHPMHIHGYNFHVLGQGFGNYDSSRDQRKLNFVNPTIQNTVNVPRNGWVVIRFRADNPGVWFMHCHNEGHHIVGLAGAFIVENGPTFSSSLQPPPPDLPKCHLV